MTATLRDLPTSKVVVKDVKCHTPHRFEVPGTKKIPSKPFGKWMPARSCPHERGLFLFFFITLGLETSDAQVYEP